MMVNSSWLIDGSRIFNYERLAMNNELPKTTPAF